MIINVQIHMCRHWSEMVPNAHNDINAPLVIKCTVKKCKFTPNFVEAKLPGQAFR